MRARCRAAHRRTEPPSEQLNEREHLTRNFRHFPNKDELSPPPSQATQTLPYHIQITISGFAHNGVLSLVTFQTRPHHFSSKNMVSSQVSRLPGLRVIALPLTRPPLPSPSPSPFVFYYVQSPPRPPSNNPNWFTNSTAKAAAMWASWGEAPKDSWKVRCVATSNHALIR